MTDHLSTIRQALTCPVAGFDVNPALAACDALEAERLTPEEAQDIKDIVESNVPPHLWPEIGGWTKLERRAAG